MSASSSPPPMASPSTRSASILLGMEPDEVLTTTLAGERGLGEGDIDRIEVAGPPDWRGARVAAKRPGRFHPFLQFGLPVPVSEALRRLDPGRGPRSGPATATGAASAWRDAPGMPCPARDDGSAATGRPACSVSAVSRSARAGRGDAVGPGLGLEQAPGRKFLLPLTEALSPRAWIYSRHVASHPGRGEFSARSGAMDS